jgi:hypothetical protein
MAGVLKARRRPLHGARIFAGDELLEKSLVGRQVGKVPCAAQFERLVKAGLQMAVRGFDRTILVADAGVVAGRLHAVMATELGIARRFIVPAGQVPIRRREPVGAVRAGYPAELPERLLDAFGQRGEALAAADRLDVLPAAEGEPEVIEQMGERHPGEGNAEPAAVGEIRKRLQARRMFLAKDQLPFRPLGRPPMRHPTLQRAQHPVGIACRMATLQFFEQRRRSQTRHGGEHGYQLLAPNLGEGILAGAIAPRPVALAW